jgi:hypothetical protein
MSMSLIQCEGGCADQAHAAVAACFAQLAPPDRFPGVPVQSPDSGKPDARLEIPLAELTFRHLRTTREIESIVHLRKEIHLVAASGHDPSFVAREKKETRRVLSQLSSAAANLSGQSA